MIVRQIGHTHSVQKGQRPTDEADRGQRERVWLSLPRPLPQWLRDRVFHQLPDTYVSERVSVGS